MVVEEKECQENKIICFLDTDEKIDNILMRLSSFKSINPCSFTFKYVTLNPCLSKYSHDSSSA